MTSQTGRDGLGPQSGTDSAIQWSTSEVFIYRQIYFNNNFTQLSNSLHTDLKKMNYNFACLIWASNVVSHTKEGCWERYLDLRRTMEHGTGRECVMRCPIILTSQQIFIGMNKSQRVRGAKGVRLGNVKERENLKTYVSMGG